MEIFKFADTLVEGLGLRQVHVKGDELWAICPNPDHQDKHPNNFSINLKTGKAYCFACHYAGNIITLLNGVGFTYERAITIWNHLKDFEEEVEVPDFELDPFMVEAYKKLGVSQYALNRVKDEDILKEYNVYSDKSGNPIFLIKSLEQRWKAVWVRDIETGKYLLIEPLQSKTFGALFGEHLPATEFTVLTEGFFDAMYVRKHTGYKTVCANGTSLTKAQLIRLKRMAPIIVFTDLDKMGRLARDRLHEQLSDVESYYCGGKYNNVDPDDLTPDQLHEVFTHKKSWVEYLNIRRSGVK